MGQILFRCSAAAPTVLSGRLAAGLIGFIRATPRSADGRNTEIPLNSYRRSR